MSNRVRFPSYFQLISTEERSAFGFYGVIREYNWKRVALIVQNENLFTVVSGNIFSSKLIANIMNVATYFFQTMTRLKLLLEDGGVEYTEKIFSTSAGIAGLGPNPFVSQI